MNNLLDEIENLLDIETDRLHALRALTAAESALLVSGRPFEIDNWCQQQKRLSGQIKTIETKRLRLIAAAARQLGVPDERLTLNQLARRVPEPHAGRLRRQAVRLTGIVSEIQRINSGNRPVLNAALRRIQGALAFLNELTSGASVYFNTGRLRSGRRSGAMVSGRI